MDGRELIARSQQGDLDPFNGLVELYQGQVYNLAYRILGSAASAEDVTQEAFISSFPNIRSFRGGSFKSWLLRIATNASYDAIRANKRQRSSSLDAMLEEEQAWEPESPTESPKTAALRSELAAEISKAFPTLLPEQRAVLVLADVEGYSYEEIG